MGKYLEFRWDTDNGIHIDHEYHFEDTTVISYETIGALAKIFYDAIFAPVSAVDKE